MYFDCYLGSSTVQTDGVKQTKGDQKMVYPKPDNGTQTNATQYKKFSPLIVTICKQKKQANNCNK